MKTIVTLAFLFCSITAFTGGCVMDDGEENLDDVETSEVEQGLGGILNPPGTKSPASACKDSCNASYNACRLKWGADACYDDWNDCRAACDAFFGPISKL